MDATTLAILEPRRYENIATFQDSLRQVNRKVVAQFSSSGAPWSPGFFNDVTWSTQGKGLATSSPLPIIHNSNGKLWGFQPNLHAYAQGTLASQPTLKQDSDGEYYAEFDGVDDNYAGITNSAGWTQDALTLPAGLTTSIGGADFPSTMWLGNITVFIVMAIRSSVTPGFIWGRNNNAIGSGRIAIGSVGGFPKFRAFQWFSAGMMTTDGATTIPVSTRVILSARFSSSATNGIKQEIFVNGTLDGSTVTGHPITSSSGRSQLGGSGIDGTLPMDYYNMIFYPYALDDDSMKVITRYFGKRYGVTVP